VCLKRVFDHELRSFREIKRTAGNAVGEGVGDSEAAELAGEGVDVSTGVVTEGSFSLKVFTQNTMLLAMAASATTPLMATIFFRNANWAAVNSCSGFIV